MCSTRQVPPSAPLVSFFFSVFFDCRVFANKLPFLMLSLIQWHVYPRSKNNLVAISGYPFAVIRIQGSWLYKRSSASLWNMASYFKQVTYQLIIDRDESLLDWKSKIGTFSTTMIYRASEDKFNLLNTFRSPVIACPEAPRMEQSICSSSGSWGSLNMQFKCFATR